MMVRKEHSSMLYIMPLTKHPVLLLVVVTAAFRTPLCKARKGGYKDTSSDELLLELFKAAKANIGIDAGIVGDMYVRPCTRHYTECLYAEYYVTLPSLSSILPLFLLLFLPRPTLIFPQPPLFSFSSPPLAHSNLST